MPQLIGELSKAGSDHAAQAIMTTDTRKKEFALTLCSAVKDAPSGQSQKAPA